jgi:hypothetical protein
MSITPLFTKIWNQSRCPSVDKLVERMWYVHIMVYCLIIKKTYIFYSETGGTKGHYFSEISQKSLMYSLSYRENLKTQCECRIVSSRVWEVCMWGQRWMK